MIVCPSCGQENPDGFRFCGACGAELIARPAPAREVRKTVTVLFCDLAGYTSRGERLDPEALRRGQSRYFEEARAALERHGGTVEKFIGDAVMAVFGIPQVHEDDALRALRAAVELRGAVAGLGLEARIGVNTGEVVAGSGDALVTGDAVNVAARLEQTAGADEILIGEQTLRLTRDAVEIELVEPLGLKGKSEPVPAFRLVRVLEGAPALARRLDSPMVGRERELGLLRQAFDRAVSERACHLFTVLGPAGVGKSRLVAELLEEIGGQAIVLSGRCLSYGEGITYWPLVDVFREAGAEKELAEALAKPTPEETFWAVRTAVERRARERPVVLVLDDLHWAEPTLLDLVEHVADLSRDAPILLICLARPELLDARPAWGGGKLNATAVLLEPLTAGESEQLVANLAETLPLDEDVRQRIVEAAEGNPLFVEEMLALVAEENGRGGDVEVPPTIQALLAARLDRLQERERQVVERASVEGKIFHRGAVAELASEEVRPEVTTHLIALVRKELIRPEQPEFEGEDAFRFRHLLIRDAAYQSVPKEERAVLHERFASWLEARGGEEYEEIVGYHLEQAYRYRSELSPIDQRALDLARRAAERIGAAGRRALDRGDMPAAANLLSRAVSFLPERDPDRLDLLPLFADALLTRGDLAQAGDVLRSAQAEAAAAQNSWAELHARLQLMFVELVVDPEGKTEEARIEFERMVPALERAGDDRTLATAWLLAAHVHLMGCRYADLYEAARRAREHARRAGDRRAEAEATGWLCSALSLGPAPVPVAAAEIRALLPEVSRAETLYALRHLGWLEAQAGLLEESRRLSNQSQEIADDLGHALQGASHAMFDGWIELLAGDALAAEAKVRRGYDALERMGEKGFLSTVAGVLAEALYRQGRYDEAEREAQVDREVAAQDDVASQMLWRTVTAKVRARRRDDEEAQQLAREAVELAEKTDFLYFWGQALEDYAEVLALAGRMDDAARCIEQAIGLYERKRVPPALERARIRLAELRGDEPPATA